jgi:hypothetical protein
MGELKMSANFICRVCLILLCSSAMVQPSVAQSLRSETADQRPSLTDDDPREKVMIRDPIIDDPRANAPTLEERLRAVEAKLDLILTHLALRPETASRLRPVRPGPVGPDGRLGDVEARTGDIAVRVETLEKRLGGGDAPAPSAPAAPATPVAQGKLVIQNWRATPQQVSVNGFRFFAQPGQNEISVPLAPVEAYLPDWESPRTLGNSFWKRNGQDYEMRVDIR